MKIKPDVVNVWIEKSSVGKRTAMLAHKQHDPICGIGHRTWIVMSPTAWRKLQADQRKCEKMCEEIQTKLKALELSIDLSEVDKSTIKIKQTQK